MDVSGLSGVSDIIGEVLATGGLDLDQLGLTRRQHDTLVDRALHSTREGTRLSNEELKKIFHERKRVESNEKEKKDLHAWMDKKRSVHAKEWKEQKSVLREAERTPYIPPSRVDEESLIRTGTLKEMQEAKQMREERRQKRDIEAMEKRKKAASELMGDIINEQSNIPKAGPSWAWDEAPVRGVGASKATRVTPSLKTGSRLRTGTTVSPKVRIAPRPKFMSPARREKLADHDQTYVSAEDYLHVRDSQEQADTRRRAAGTAGVSRTVEFTSMRTSDGLQAYAKHVENMDTGEWQENTPRAEPHREDQARAESQTRPYKPKPFTSLVRLQRPEATKGRVHRPQAAHHTDRPATRSSSVSHSTGNRQQKERLYGTKRLPGTYKATERKAPRQVKTYQERLADMKSSSPTTRPLRKTYEATGMSSAPSRMEDTFDRPRRVEKKRKTLTYAQQLQQLQPPKELYRSGENSIPMHTTTLRRSSGPAHKPKTYVQQLQELQHPATPAGPVRSKVHHGPPGYGPSRSRPYADPYSDYNQDNLSVISPWSIDENVKGLLYDEASESFLNPTSGAATDVSGLSEMDDLDLYTDQVGVHQLTEAASFSSGSIMSCIDWDAVENLIADEK